jgi:hypothetical protein
MEEKNKIIIFVGRTFWNKFRNLFLFFIGFVCCVVGRINLKMESLHTHHTPDIPRIPGDFGNKSPPLSFDCFSLCNSSSAVIVWQLLIASYQKEKKQNSKDWMQKFLSFNLGNVHPGHYFLAYPIKEMMKIPSTKS